MGLDLGGKNYDFNVQKCVQNRIAFVVLFH